MQKLPAQQKRAFWLRQLYLWHWISSAGCLVGMLLFAVTGLTLNNASHIEAKPIVKKSTIVLPSSLLTYLQAQPVSNKASLPHAVADWLMRSMELMLLTKPQSGRQKKFMFHCRVLAAMPG